MPELLLLSRVEVAGLVKAPELNGKQGTVLGQQGERYTVRLDGAGQAKALRGENLQLCEGLPLMTHVEIAGLASAPELNGKHGLVLGRQGERYMVQADGAEQPKALRRENLEPFAELPPLARVAIAGLSGAPELNGRGGTVLGRQGPRYLVLVEGLDEVKSLKHRNLALEPEAEPSSEEAAGRPDECRVCHEPLWPEGGGAGPAREVASLVCHHAFHSACLEAHQRTERHTAVFGDRRCCPLCGTGITYWGAWKQARSKWQAPLYWAERIHAVLRAALPAPAGAPWRDVAEAVRCAEGLSEEALLEALHGHGPPYSDPSRPGGAAACCKVAMTGSPLQKALELDARPRVRRSAENDWQGLHGRGRWELAPHGRSAGGALADDARVSLRTWGVLPGAQCAKCHRTLREGWLLCDGPCRAFLDTLYCSAACRGGDAAAHRALCEGYKTPSWEPLGFERRSL